MSSKIFPLDPDASDHLVENDAADPETEARYPVENGAVRWDDAANEGNTQRKAQA